MHRNAAGALLFVCWGDRDIALLPLVYGARLAIGPHDDEAGFDDVWDYDDLDAAITAFLAWAWTRAPEPNGWTRHPASGRRRPAGDAKREYVLP